MRKLRIFVSYARKDREFLDRLLTHLAPLEAEGLIEPWTDLEIEPGGHWDATIAGELERADIVLLLVSADFLASSYISGVELRRALEREQKGEVVLIPVILKFADWATSPLHHLQALPTNARPITDWRNRDEAYLDVALGVRRVSGGTGGEAEGVCARRQKRDATAAYLLRGAESRSGGTRMLSSCEGGSKSGDSSRIVNAPAFRPPRASCAWYALGLAFEKQNKNDAARNALERAVRLDPANADARLLLASILAGHDAPQAKEQIEILNKDASLSPAKVAAVKNLQQQLIQKP